MGTPYTVILDGVPVQCETPEDALALVRLHGATPAPQPGAGTGGGRPNGQPPQGTRWTDQRVADFFKLIEGKQRKLVDALLETEDARTDRQLLQTLGLASGNALAGVFAGLYKNAKKVGADPRELYLKKPITIDDKRGYEYTLSAGFRHAASRRAKS